MEREIGEIFEFGGEWYQCLKSPDGTCTHCDMNFGGKCPIPIKECVASSRSDLSYVIFKKLEKVGEPYDDYSPSGRVIYFQRYKCYQKPIDTGDIIYWADNIHISIEIKQNKEDMEEKKLNLKPFDLQKAKAGKPVCTKDGRKARIVCFDRNDLYPIVALIECEDGKEMIGAYSKEGCTEIYEIKGTDLMMLPEKRSGWAKVRKDINLYDTKEEADRKMIGNDEYVTAKVFWEE